ncbi:MAG: hypothetical protein KF690_11015 [Bacteroidetes bacterium]|nr:hypothetical protein [Bacteroidota bacterium]
MQTNTHNGLGLVAAFKRDILTGAAYESIIPAADMRDTVVKRHGNLPDTVAAMKRIAHQTRSDTAHLAPRLKGRNVEDTCRKLWHFVYWHIQYELDKPGTEQLRRPARSWADRHRGVDCDCYSLFISTVLLNLQIPHSFRITEYRKEDGWQHVYVIVPAPTTKGYYTLDAVLDQFDLEKPFRRKQDHPMNIAYLSGPGDVPDIFSLTGLGAIPESDTPDTLKRYLEHTRSLVANHPEQLRYLVNPQQYVQMLDYALKYWDTPQRDEALAILAEQESRIQIHPGLRGLEGYELGGLFQKIGQAIKNTVQKVGEGLKEFVENPLHVLNKVNPATVLARNGYLLYLSTAGKNQAEKLKWGYLTDEQARARQFNMADVQRWRDMIRKVEDIYDKIGGEKSKLRETILHHGGGLGHPSLGALGEPATAAAIAAAGTVIAAVAKLLSDLKGDRPAQEAIITDPTTDGGLVVALQKGQQAVLKAQQAVSPAASVLPRQQVILPTPAPAAPAPAYSEPPVRTTDLPSVNPSSQPKPSIPMSESNLPAAGQGPPEKGFLEKAKDFVQKNPLLVIGAAVGGYLLFTKSGKKTAQQIGEIAGLGSPKRRQRRRKKRSPAAYDLGAPGRRKRSSKGKTTRSQRKRIKRAYLR